MKSEAISESDFDMYVKLLKSGTPLSATQTLELSSISLRKVRLRGGATRDTAE